jgi:hypothetical protein
MAAVALTARNVFLIQGDDDARGAVDQSGGSNLDNLKRCFVTFDSNGTSMVGGTDTITLNLATAIQNKTRNGKTVTVETIAVSQAITVSASGVETSYAGYATLSSNVLTIVPKSDGYLTGSTNATVTGTSTVVRPYGVFCAYVEN